ncbi:MAG: efflux RND transporter periplasmic adaptor subunit [PVC group bacterium]
MNNHTKSKARSPSRIRVFLLSLLILLVAIGVAWRLIRTAPRPAVRPPQERAALVEAAPLVRGDGEVIIEATGTVVPAHQVSLQSRVSGQIVRMNPSFVPGGRLAAGEEVLRIDPEDYRLAVERQKAQVVQAEQEYRIEMGRQDIARHEWSLLSDRVETAELDSELALRLPQLQQAEAALSSARAALQQAELDLARTSVPAPFNAVVLTKDVEVGTQVSSSTVLGTLAGTDEFWVSLTLPVAGLAMFSAGTGEEGAAVKLNPAGRQKEGMEWDGRVIRKQADLEEKGRLARAIVSVPGPLADPDRYLLLGMYVSAQIRGRKMEKVFPIPRRALRGAGKVWLISEDSRLEIRPVEIAWGGKDRVLVRDGLEPGRLLVVSDLAAPVEGMLLRVVDRPGEDEQ